MRSTFVLCVGALVALAGVVPAQTVSHKQSGVQGRARAPRVPTNYEMLIDFWIETYGLAAEEQADDEGSLPFDYVVEAKSQPDECYGGIGVDVPQTPPFCPEGTLEKRNGTYVWGLDVDEANDRVWFGTGNNVQCLAGASFTGGSNPDDNSDYVCEFAMGPYPRQFPWWPEQYGDFRPPRIFSLDLDPFVGGPGLVERTGSLNSAAEFLRNSTLGFRTVGVHNGVVLFGGPNIGLGGINLFAFTTGGTFLGSTTLYQYDNIRKFLIVDGVMYCGVLNGILNPNPGGSVLRWNGNASTPFQFSVVGTLDNEVSELAVHQEGAQRYLVASTWSGLWSATAGGTGLAGVVVSPAIPGGGLTVLNAGGWTKVWQADQYEPDPVTAASYGLGGIASFDGHLYFGTMHGFGLGVIAWIEANGNITSNQQLQQVFAGTTRALSFFRGRLEFGPGGPALVDIDLLYGNRRLPVYNTTTEEFELVANNTGPAVSGEAGFNSFYNHYTWTALVHDGYLYVGTLDLAYLLLGIDGSSPLPDSATFALIGERSWGCDLVVFAPGNLRGRKVVNDGFANDTNYGVRTLVSGTDGDLWVGTANPSTLKAEGGWELIRCSPNFPD